MNDETAKGSHYRAYMSDDSLQKMVKPTIDHVKQLQVNLMGKHELVITSLTLTL
jgi:hypothetical protein